jgi:16S rRNA processing protein RimM
VFVVVGIVRRPHGLKGELLVSVETDFPERLVEGASLYLSDDHREVTIRSRRQHSDGLLLSFEEFPNKQSVENLHNLPLYRRTSDAPELPEGQYYQHQLLGLNVVEENGELVGKLAQIFNTGASDVYVVRDEAGKEILLPAISDVILRIELENKQIVVHLLPGLR